MALFTVDRLTGCEIQEGELIWSCAVNAANILRDVREMITNTFGGRMNRYERVIEQTVQRALDQLEEAAKEKGYDGCLGVRISHPTIVHGGVEVVAYGTGFHYVGVKPTTSLPS
jgi:uncharacterized protein YbjQ (UPF0145 family)